MEPQARAASVPRNVNANLTNALAAILLGLVLLVPASPSLGAVDFAIVESVVGSVFGNTLNRRIEVGERLFPVQRVRAGSKSAAVIRFADDSRLIIGPESEITLEGILNGSSASVTNGSNEPVTTVMLNAGKGIFRFVPSSAGQHLDLRHKASEKRLSLSVAPETLFDLLVSPRATEIAVRSGVLRVDSETWNETVGAGEALKIPARSDRLVSERTSSEMRSASWKLSALVPARRYPINRVASTQKRDSVPRDAAGSGDVNGNRTASPPRPNDAKSAAKTKPLPPKTDSTLPCGINTTNGRDETILRAAVAGKNPENILCMHLVYGLVVIEMRPDIAPKHVARIRALVRAQFYDGVPFHSVVSHFVAETGDPTGTGGGGSGILIPAEFSDMQFVRGSIGMKHWPDEPDSADSQFFIVLNRREHLDGNYTYWGRVIFGMHRVEMIRTGKPPKNPDRIVRLRVMADSTG